jgi:hypothetical protein
MKHPSPFKFKFLHYPYKMDKYVIISAAVAGIVTWLFMYLDARLFDTPKSKFTYFKGIAFVSSLVAAVVYFMSSMPGVGQTGGSSAIGTPLDLPVTMVKPGDMMTGLPPF